MPSAGFWVGLVQVCRKAEKSISQPAVRYAQPRAPWAMSSLFRSFQVNVALL
jgi:hypothetical protein